MSNFIRQWNLQRDELLASGNILTRFDGIDGLIRNIDYVDMDSIEGKNQQELWSKMRRIARKLSKSLDDKVHVEGDVTFHLHKGFKIKGSKGEIYSPLTLDLDDGQVLTALFKNLRKSGDKVNPTKPTKVYAWYLNKQNITEYVFKGGEPKDNAELTRRLAFIIEKMHSKFIAKNPISESPKVIKARIDAMDIDLSNVVYSGNADAEKQKRIKELQVQYDADLIYSGDVNTRSGAKVLEEKLARNRAIEAELKELGGEVPKPTPFAEPKIIREAKQIFYINLSEDDVMRYGKEILKKLGADGRLKGISYKIQFTDKRGFKKIVGDGLGDVKLDSIDDIVITTSKEPTEHDKVIKDIISTVVANTINKKEYLAKAYKIGVEAVSNNESTTPVQNKKLIDFMEKNKISYVLSNDLDLDLEVTESFNSGVEFAKKENSERFGAGHMGGVDTVIWDRQKTEHGDYKRVGTIDKGHAVIKEEYQDNQEAIEFAKRMGAETFEHDKPKITPENIAEFYPSMSDEEKVKLSNLEAIGFKFLNRYNDYLYDEKIYENGKSGVYTRLANKDHTILTFAEKFKNNNGYDEYKVSKSAPPSGKLDSLKLAQSGLRLIGIEIFGVKDNLQPVDEYIEEIKKSEEYKDYLYQNRTVEPLDIQKFNKKYDAELREVSSKHEMEKELSKVKKNKSVVFESPNELHRINTREDNRVIGVVGNFGTKDVRYYIDTKIDELKSEPTYNFDKFNSITSSKEFQKAQEELEEQLEADGTIDDFEDKLEDLDKQFAELIAKELTDA